MVKASEVWRLWLICPSKAD